MKAKRIRTTACAVMIAMFLGGCGEVPLIELTAEEENIITLYSAKIVAKHNVRLAQGLVRHKGAPEEVEEPAPAPEDTAAEEAQMAEGQLAGAADGSMDAAVTAAQNASNAALNDIFGTSGLDFSFSGAAFENDFVYNNYYHLTPDAGNCYLVMRFNVSNLTDQAIDADLYSYDPVFTAIVDGAAYESETTILPNDLATYLTTIEGKGTDTAVLLFEVPTSGSMNVDSVGLQLQVGGSAYNISL